MKQVIILSIVLCLAVSVSAIPKDRKPTKCVVGGCSSQLCVPEGSDPISTCEWKDEYECYKSAICREQFFGRCGWVQNSTLKQCIKEKREQNPIDSTQAEDPKVTPPGPKSKPEGSEADHQGLN